MNVLAKNAGGLWIAAGSAAGTLAGVLLGYASVGLALGVAAGIVAGLVTRRLRKGIGSTGEGDIGKLLDTLGCIDAIAERMH